MLMNPADAFYICAGLTHIRMENGLPTLDIDMEREASLMEKIYPFFYEGDTVGAYMKDDSMTVCNMFING